MQDGLLQILRQKLVRVTIKRWKFRNHLRICLSAIYVYAKETIIKKLNLENKSSLVQHGFISNEMEVYSSES